MALTLSAHQSTLNRPTRPNVGANGIAHATRSGGTAAQTKADRIVTKAAWVTWSDAWKATYRSSGDHSTEFTVSGSAITYADD
jgi:hypothetical protein